MPTVLVIDGFRFFFYSNEIERMHIHVEFDGKEIKIWLDTFEIARSDEIPFHKQNLIVKLVRKNEKRLKKAWIAYFG